MKHVFIMNIYDLSTFRIYFSLIFISLLIILRLFWIIQLQKSAVHVDIRKVQTQEDFLTKHLTTLPTTLTFCILIPSKLISLHFEGWKLKVLLEGYVAAVDPQVYTQRELCFEDFLFVFQGCALLTLLEGNVSVMMTQWSLSWKPRSLSRGAKSKVKSSV